MSWFNFCCNNCRNGCNQNRCCNQNIGNTCPLRGPQGPVGPQGPAGADGISEIDSLLVANPVTQTVANSATINLGSLVSSIGDDIVYSAPLSATLYTGTYLVQANALSTGTTTAGMSISVNGSVVPTANSYVTTTNPTQISLTHVVTVDSGTASVSLTNQSGESVTYDDVTLSIIKLA